MVKYFHRYLKLNKQKFTKNINKTNMRNENINNNNKNYNNLNQCNISLKTHSHITATRKTENKRSKLNV